MLKEIAAQVLEPIMNMNGADIERALEVPPQSELGDLAFPCFPLAKQWRRSPQQIAVELAERINQESDNIRMRAEASGGYVNISFDQDYYGEACLARMQEPFFGKLSIGEGQRVVIDMSSPNIAKPFSVGHLRSTMIGNALAHLYEAAGYEVLKVNHLGDWGTQFGKLITAYKLWGDDGTLRQDPIRESLKLYVRFHEVAEQQPELEDEAREWFRKLEAGDAETVQLWTYFVNASMVEFNRMYERLGVHFDHVLGESFYNDKMDAVVAHLQQLQLLEESDGAMVVRLDDEGMPPCLILKSNGTTIYPTRDLATAIYRKEVMKADKLIYVVGAEQQLHFQQVFAVLGKMGYEWAQECTHVPFGLMTFEGKKMSTRKGKVIFLDEVLNEAENRALQIIEDKNPSLQEKAKVASKVGIGAIIFGDLKSSRMLSVDFNLEDALRYEGETGPYVQFTLVRAKSLLIKGGWTSYSDCPADTGVLGKDASECAGEQSSMKSTAAGGVSQEAWICLKSLSKYERALQMAVDSNEPSIFARYLLDAAKQFNRYYHQEQILVENEIERRHKLRIVAAVAHVLEAGLNLLGVEAPEHM
ncbi:arginine--tRNA ligase [Paenibacillus sp. MER 180]|uniref:arginine--tRNA ligase n=1 Tax=Paenibacillus sp. MER 180 TaxID=2939570 RepID=UPI00203A3ACC|nr:arginine--tRNA ligase [Paenibacillus sp. MER 180]MCM3291581.1 arginine--tRNA ligase [Paenibacillus sp. MER 180]